MNKEQLLEAIKSLEAKGYKKNFSNFKELSTHGNGRYYLYKPMIYREDEDGKNRAITEVIMKIWHFLDYADRVDENTMFSIEPAVDFSRNVDERIILTLSHPNRSVEEVEEIATKFDKWASKYIKEKRDLI